MIRLRPYQLRTVALVRQHWRERPVVMLPTAAGKTVIACSMIHGALAKGNRSLFLVHRRELVRQAVDRLADWGIDAGVIAAGWKPEPEKLVQVASIPTLIRRHKPEAAIAIVDECHHARSRTWEEVLAHYECIIGLSATPYRLDGRGLGTIFGTILKPVTVRELCEEGVLISPRVLAPPGPDMEGVRTVGGEYDAHQAEQRMNKLTGRIVDHWHEHAKGARTVAFAVSIEHSRTIVHRFRESGIEAEHIDGATPRNERDAVLARLAEGATCVVSNCMVLGEGWDLPALEVAILARPTASMALHRQQIGRIMRSAPGKDGALVLDHAGNTHRHGLVTEEVDVDLNDGAKRKHESLKTCPECFCVCSQFEEVCPECGHVFAAKKQGERDLNPEETNGRLVEISIDKRAVYAGLIEDANRYGNRLGWARHKFKSMFGDWPNAGRHLGRKAKAMEEEYRCTEYEPRSSEYRDFCGRCYRNAREHEGVRV